MKRTEIYPMPEYFDRYINLVEDIELSEAFEKSIEQLNALDAAALRELDNRTYAEGKWTVKAILQHIIDFERIFCYRTLLFARREGSVPQGVDENLIAANSNADRRPVEEIIAELKAVRAATKALFESFDDETLRHTGRNWKSEISVAGMGFVTLGHQIHHFRIIEEKYFSLLNQS